MKKYIVVEKPFVLAAGILELTKEQYHSRKHCLKPTKKKGEYEIIGNVCFKIGEKIGYDGQAPKIVQTNLVTPEEYAKDIPEVENEKTVEAFRADIEALKTELSTKDFDLEVMEADLSVKDEELAVIKAKLEKMAKVNQELLKKNEKLEAAKG